jgi:hypothetical protein
MHCLQAEMSVDASSWVNDLCVPFSRTSVIASLRSAEANSAACGELAQRLAEQKVRLRAGEVPEFDSFDHLEAVHRRINIAPISHTLVEQDSDGLQAHSQASCMRMAGGARQGAQLPQLLLPLLLLLLLTVLPLHAESTSALSKVRPSLLPPPNAPLPQTWSPRSSLVA